MLFFKSYIPVETFYNVPLGSDYEVWLNISAIPKPTAIEWFYGPDFKHMPYKLHIPSDDGKLITSWTVNNNHRIHISFCIFVEH